MASFLALSRAEAEEAKRTLRLRLRFHLGTLACAAAALFVSAPVAYYLALGSLACEGAAWLLRHQAAEQHTRAEEGRRRETLVRALGTDPSRIDVVDVTQRFSSRARADADRWEDPRYWATQADPGPEKLRDSLHESAFWSKHLYGKASARAFKRTGGLGALAILGLLILVFVGSGDAKVTSARLLVVVLSFLVATDELSEAVAWRGASIGSDHAERDLRHADLGELDVALAVLGDYFVVTATAPPIPSEIYKANHDELNAAWARHLRGIEPGPASSATDG
jgi:hypothetical protein